MPRVPRRTVLLHGVGVSGGIGVPVPRKLTRVVGIDKDGTTELFRPVGPSELDLIRQGDFHRFPPRLDGQPFFYPVLTFEYAEKIARDWNVRDFGSGAVLAFRVRSQFLEPYELKSVGGSAHQE